MEHQPTIQFRPISELTPYAKNARTHSPQQVEQIAQSIRVFGWTNPVLADDKGIVAGHGRVLGAERLYARGDTIRLPGGQELPAGTVPVLDCTGWDAVQRQAYILADNQLALNAGWDTKMLAGEVAELQLGGFDLDNIGFGGDELARLLAVAGATPTGRIGEDDVPPVDPAALTTQPGQTWVLGPHRLHCGDSTRKASYDRLLGKSKVDLVWTDPPYNVAVDGKAGKILNDDMSTAAFERFMSSVYTRLHDAMRPGACIYVAHGESERATFTSTFVSAGLKLSQVLVWVKQSATLSRQDFNWQHEPILYGWKEGAGHYFCGDFTRTTVIDDDIDLRKLKREQLIDLINEMRAVQGGTAIRHDRPTRSDLHPTMKPVSLVQRMVEWSSKPGQTVLDAFGGSGSTLIACEKSGRSARLLELDPKFCDVIVRRWQQFTGKTAHLSGDGRSFDEIAASTQAQPLPEAA